MFETVKNRRTIRKYQQKDIAPDLLNDLLETSFRASTMGGMQLYSVIVTRDAEMKEKLSPDRKSTRLNSSHLGKSRMPSSA